TASRRLALREEARSAKRSGEHPVLAKGFLAQQWRLRCSHCPWSLLSPGGNWSSAWTKRLGRTGRLQGSPMPELVTECAAAMQSIISQARPRLFFMRDARHVVRWQNIPASRLSILRQRLCGDEPEG